MANLTKTQQQTIDNLIQQATIVVELKTTSHIQNAAFLKLYVESVPIIPILRQFYNLVTLTNLSKNATATPCTAAKDQIRAYTSSCGTCGNNAQKNQLPSMTNKCVKQDIITQAQKSQHETIKKILQTLTQINNGEIKITTITA